MKGMWYLNSNQLTFFDSRVTSSVYSHVLFTSYIHWGFLFLISIPIFIRNYLRLYHPIFLSTTRLFVIYILNHLFICLHICILVFQTNVYFINFIYICSSKITCHIQHYKIKCHFLHYNFKHFTIYVLKIIATNIRLCTPLFVWRSRIIHHEIIDSQLR